MSTAAKYFLKVNDVFSLASDNDAYGVMIERIRAVARQDVTVLLIGDPGSGKEVVAESIHSASGKKGPLIKVTCAALPSTLLESELFGHVRGAFSGSTCDHKGRFEQAKDGTLFLDEICQMDYDLQAKLLRAVEYGEFNRVGSEHTEKANARIIVAVNLDIGRALKERRFRNDLYYRFANYVIRVPSLQDRPEDVNRLVNFFLQKICTQRGINDIAPDCLRRLLSCKWPGNIRELRAVIEAGAINAAHRKGQILELSDLDEFPSEIAEQTCGGDETITTLVNRLYQKDIDLPGIEANLKCKVLSHVRDREQGNTKSISSLLGIKVDAVRTMYARAGLALGRSFSRIQAKRDL
jgi:anaerobic nitric oxide reductase transcription regulator